MYIYKRIYVFKTLFPVFVLVLKFDVNLGIWDLIFKNTFPHMSFENEIQTLQLDIKFSNP